MAGTGPLTTAHGKPSTVQQSRPKRVSNPIPPAPTATADLVSFQHANTGNRCLQSKSPTNNFFPKSHPRKPEKSRNPTQTQTNMAGNLDLPLIDLSSPDRSAEAKSIRQACLDHGFFYLTNHGIPDSTFQQVFNESSRFFSLSLPEKMRFERSRFHRGYTPLYSEKLDPSAKIKGDTKESFYIGPVEGRDVNLNQWPSEDSLPLWRATMESYYNDVLSVGKRLVALIALALNLDEQYFEKIGALTDPLGFVRLLHYPDELDDSRAGKYGASAHSDYGMVTLLATDGVPGLQICRDKDAQPQVWEDVPHVPGAFIVNVGDMLERWTNCLFRSTLHRVVPLGRERYSVAFFLDPNADCVVEVLESCCSEASPPRFPPIRSFDYIMERIRVTYSVKKE